MLALPCHAAGDGEALREALPPEAAEMLEEVALSQPEPEEGLGAIWGYLKTHLRENLGEALRPAASVLAIALLCAMGEPFTRGGRFSWLMLGGCLGVFAVSAADLRSALVLGRETVENLTDFSKVLLPMLTTAAVSAGAFTSAGAMYAASAFCSDLLLTASRDLILPLITALAVTAAAGAALGTKQLQSAEKLLGWSVRTLLKYLVLAFTAWLSLTGVLRGAADAAAVRLSRAAISTALPVVGRSLAEASEALVAGAGMLRSALGLAGALSVLAAIALPLLRLGLRCLIFRAAAALASLVAGERLGRLLSALCTVYGLLTALVGASAAVLLMGVVSLVRTAGG